LTCDCCDCCAEARHGPGMMSSIATALNKTAIKDPGASAKFVHRTGMALSSHRIDCPAIWNTDSGIPTYLHLRTYDHCLPYQTHRRQDRTWFQPRFASPIPCSAIARSYPTAA
jgi:hypothetical protein